MHSKTAYLALLAAAVFSPAVAFAQSPGDQHPWFTSDFTVTAGAYFTSQDYTLGAGIDEPGSGIDFNGKLGVDDSQTSFTGGLRWNFGEKWSFRTQYISFDVAGSAVLKEDITFNDITYRAGSNVSSGIDTTIVRAFFGREFSAGPRHEFGAGLGLHWMEIEAFVSGEVLTDQDQSSGVVRSSAQADLPLPNIGVWYWYAPTPRWMLTSRVDWLSASVGDYSGGLWNVGVGTQYQLTKHIGIGAEYAYFEVDGEVDDSSWRGDVVISSNGPLVYLTANW